MNTLQKRITSLPDAYFTDGNISIRPIRDDYDIWYATVECTLFPHQKENVNPAGFSLGRAFLYPKNYLPCIIWKENTRIGFILLFRWSNGSANGWSYYLDQNYQGQGYGKTAARLAINILKSAEPTMPIKISVEQANEKAQLLYRSIGMQEKGEMDGDDLVFEF
jgi:diamine N-acetyltransferase